MAERIRKQATLSKKSVKTERKIGQLLERSLGVFVVLFNRKDLRMFVE